MRPYSTFYFLGTGWAVLSRHNSGGGYVVSAQSDDATASVTLTPTAAPADYSDCTGYLPHVKDGYCDNELNIADCGYDGGDCCACTCVDSATHTCGELGGGYDCQDPAVPDGCGETPSPAAAFGFPDCEGYMYSLQNGYCNDDLNNAECGYDGGDCCRCTCRNYSQYASRDDDYVAEYYNNCGNYGYDCQDPDAPTECDVETDSPTPSPSVNPDTQYCKGVISNIANGDCNSYNNNAACDYDGGDCCPCSCEDGSYYICGPYYDCLDPETDCTTTSTSTYNSYYNNDYWRVYTPSPVYVYYNDDYSTIRSTATSKDDDFRNNYVASDDDDCPGRASGGNGFCTTEYNTPDCDYDGGDCCECTCTSSDSECGVNGYECLDPTCRYFSTTSENDDFTAGAASAESSSTSSLSTQEFTGFIVVAILGFCLFGSLIACGSNMIMRRWTADKSNYAVPPQQQHVVLPVSSRAPPVPVRLPPTAPAYEESKRAEADFYRGRFGTTGHEDRQIAAHLQQHERAKAARHEQRRIDAAIYQRSMLEQTIAETMYQGRSTRSTAIAERTTSAPAVVARSEAYENGAHAERQIASSVDPELAGAEESKEPLPERKKAAVMGESGQFVAVTGTGRSNDKQGISGDIETGSSTVTDGVVADGGPVVGEEAGSDESDTNSNTGEAPATDSEDVVPSDEEGVAVGVVVSQEEEEGEPAGDNSSEDRSDIVEDVVVELTSSSSAAVSGEGSQDLTANSAIDEAESVEDSTEEEASDEVRTPTENNSEENVEAGSEGSGGVVESKTTDEEEVILKE